MGKDIITIEEATSEEKRRSVLEGRLDKQESLTWQIVVGVVIAFVFTIGLVGVEIMLFHTRENKDSLDMQNKYFQEMKEVQKDQYNMELRLLKEIDALRSSNLPAAE